MWISLYEFAPTRSARARWAPARARHSVREHRRVRSDRHAAAHGRLAVAITGLLFIGLLAVSCNAFAQEMVWVSHGPAPNTLGQVEEITDFEVVGAIQAVALHPSEANVAYVGAVNGGIWKTSNLMSASPNWQPMAANATSLSIGALEFDPMDPTHQTLVAGTGQFSSFSLGGALDGLVRTTDSGASWTMIDGGGALRGINITGVAPRANVLVISADNEGILRSTNTGATWTRVSGGAGTGLPRGLSFDLASDPTNPARLFTNAGASGIYLSTDTGATWKKVSSAEMDALIGAQTSNIRIAVGTSNNISVAVANSGQLAGLFRSGDGGATWTTLDLPSTVEAGRSFGIHPGGQAGIHFSIAADPSNPNIVYLGGDRQPSLDEADADAPVQFPNSIGARDYSGRLFRVDASRPAGSQSTPLTHSYTASNSSPHGDSRDMDMAANGILVEVDDGGIYRRTNPQARNGDWFSANGDIKTTEFHSAAWDANANIVVGGAQDTGTTEQRPPGRWRSVSTGDGGVVAVDDTSTPGFSTRYSSWQYLEGFRRRVFDATNVLQSEVFPSLMVLNGQEAIDPQFYTPIELNKVEPTRMIFGGKNGVYESLDQGDTVERIQPRLVVNASGPIAYGGVGDPDILYIGSGTRVFVRTKASPAALIESASYPGDTQVMGIALDPGDPRIAYVIDTANVYRTTDAGVTWANISGNLPTLGPGFLLTVAYSTSSNRGGVVVAGSKGVFLGTGPTFSSWSKLGTGLPLALVLQLEYDAADDILLAATLGRGAYTLNLAGH
jgi:photosystem II stability/assembly factor-like uncharacterized protein